MSAALTKLDAYESRNIAMQEIRLRNMREWELRKLRSEIIGLTREERHLTQKREERPLTPWEEQRLEELPDEAMEVLQNLSALKRK